MAKIPFGILGPFFGKAGTVSGYMWKGIPVMRALRRPTNKPPTPAQVQQRAKFGFTSRFLGGLSSEFIKTGFHELAKGKTEFQCAMSYNIAHAISGTHPDFKIHYELVCVSRGQLPNAVLPEVKMEGDKIRFFWADNTGIGMAAAGNRAMLAAYCPANNEWCSAISDAQRADCSALLPVINVDGSRYQTWLSFVSADGVTADSIYTGEVMVI